jgi:hypothetical protein
MITTLVIIGAMWAGAIFAVAALSIVSVARD